MAKLLKPMIIVLLLLSVSALVLGVMLFLEREIIKARTQRLEAAAIAIARSLNYPDLNPERLKDFERMEGELRRLDVHAAQTYQDLLDTIADLEATRMVLEETREELRITKNRLEAAELEIASLQETLAQRTAELARANQQIGQLERERTELQNRIESLELRIVQMEDEREERIEEIAYLQGIIDQLDPPDPGARATTPEGLTGKILVVNSDWNFVVLDVGSADGLGLASELLVHRGEELIGRVRVSDVKEQRAVAEIIREWELRPLREGDDVLF